mmetsp:Transcript_51715/g.135960  ORF Transcript_51715/g.135960 Transcript_51715/m.135960 type:complete len:256 (-) Transcript_51715:70-837(-)
MWPSTLGGTKPSASSYHAFWLPCSTLRRPCRTTSSGGRTRLRTSVEESAVSIIVEPRALSASLTYSQFGGMMKPSSSSEPGRSMQRKCVSAKNCFPACGTSSQYPGSAGANHEFTSMIWSAPHAKLKSASGYFRCNVRIRTILGIAQGLSASSSHTFTPKREPNIVSTARWHMTNRWIILVFSWGLSGRMPHGVIHTSSTSFECRISDATFRCAFVIGLNEPPYMAIRLRSGGFRSRSDCCDVVCARITPNGVSV